MKLLVDTSVWSLALRRRPSAVLSAEEKRLTAILTEAITDGRVAMIGPIRQELLSGVKEQAQFNRLRSALAAFRDEGIATVDYEEAARLYNLCRSRGVECAPVDILICALARRRKWDVLANDSVMKQCVAVIAEHGQRLAPARSPRKVIRLGHRAEEVVVGCQLCGRLSPD